MCLPWGGIWTTCEISVQQNFSLGEYVVLFLQTYHTKGMSNVCFLVLSLFHQLKIQWYDIGLLCPVDIKHSSYVRCFIFISEALYPRVLCMGYKHATDWISSYINVNTWDQYSSTSGYYLSRTTRSISCYHYLEYKIHMYWSIWLKSVCSTSG